MGETTPTMQGLEIVRTNRVVWAIVALNVFINAAAIALGLLDRQVQTMATTIMFTLVGIAFSVIGALIISRHLGNVIGWLFIAVALFLSLAHSLIQNYAVYALVVSPGSVPFGKAAFWLSSSALDGIFTLTMTLLLLLFPTGRPLTPRWRIAVAAAIAGAIGSAATGFGDLSPSGVLSDVKNPLELSGTAATVASAIAGIGNLLIFASFFAGVVAVVLRFRRSAGIERQQVKWIMAGVVFVAVLILASTVMTALGVGDLSGQAFVIALALFPTLMGVAILRYHLYDIDLVIRRTLVYACLIVVLAALYLGGIALLGAAFRAATGESGALAVTISTLVVALAFQPLRRRIQRAIDHRFARRAYDAEATVQAFAGRLREQIDLDVLGRELVGVVDDTVQPRQATLWLRPRA